MSPCEMMKAILVNIFRYSFLHLLRRRIFCAGRLRRDNNLARIFVLGIVFWDT